MDKPAEFSTNSMEDTYLVAAYQLGIPFEEAVGADRYWWIGDANRRILLRRSSLGVNPAPVVHFTSDKAASQRRLAAHGVPVPDFLFLRLHSTPGSEIADALKFASGRYPVVSKPNFGSRARGVYTDIRDRTELLRVLAMQHRSGIREILLEEHVDGEVHRVIVMDDEVLDVCRWGPSMVVGDGCSTVRALIARLNEPATGYPRIAITPRTVDVLEKQGHRVDSVLPRDRRIRVVEAGVARGARRERVPLARIPTVNLDCFVDARRAVGSRLLGIDLICESVTRPWQEQVFRINEVNSSPGLALRYPNADPGDLEVAVRILEMALG